MTNNVEQAVVEIIEAAKGAVGDMAGFVAAQAPDVLEQLVLWKIVGGAIRGLFGVVLLLVAVKCWGWARKYWEEDIVGVGAMLLCAVCALFGPILLVDGTTAAAKGLVSPKLTAVEAVADLVRPHSSARK